MLIKRVIKKNDDFQEIIQSRQVVKTKSFFVYFSSRSNPEFKHNYLHFGISVGKKMGNAVYRNRIRRQVRNMIYNFNIEGTKSFYFIIIVRKNFDMFSFSNNKEMLLKTVKQIIAKTC